MSVSGAYQNYILYLENQLKFKLIHDAHYKFDTIKINEVGENQLQKKCNV
jgi:hypothetical protein